MQIREYKTIFQQALSPLYDDREIESFFFLVLEHLHGLKRIDLALHPQQEMGPQQSQRWQTILSGLKNEVPLQYLLGETEFFGLRFLVDPSVLIPRPETEELVEWVITENRKPPQDNWPDAAGLKAKNPRILDIGTGSGCIAISLAKNIPGAGVFAIDVSPQALAVAKKNAQANGVAVTFMEQDILKTDDLLQQFDVIVSNPPYVRMLEKAEIKHNVLENEPHLALFVEDDDALLFYRKIAGLAKKNLTENGRLYFEINQYLGKQTVALLESEGFKNVALKKDIYGNDRMVACTLSAAPPFFYS